MTLVCVLIFINFLNIGDTYASRSLSDGEATTHDSSACTGLFSLIQKFRERLSLIQIWLTIITILIPGNDIGYLAFRPCLVYQLLLLNLLQILIILLILPHLLRIKYARYLGIKSLNLRLLLHQEVSHLLL